MAEPKKAITPTAISRELTTLKQRVKWLEAALKPKRDKPAVDRSAAGSRRETAEKEARNKALSEYYAKCHEDRLRRKAERDYWQGKRDAQLLADPDAMARARKAEREFNDFLKARGIKPLPSRLPKRALPKRPARR